MTTNTQRTSDHISSSFHMKIWQAYSYHPITRVKNSSALTNSEFPQLYLYKMEILTSSYRRPSYPPPCPLQVIVRVKKLSFLRSLGFKVRNIQCCALLTVLAEAMTTQQLEGRFSTAFQSFFQYLLHFHITFRPLSLTGLLFHGSCSGRPSCATALNILSLLGKRDCYIMIASATPTPKVIKFFLAMSLSKASLPQSEDCLHEADSLTT